MEAGMLVFGIAGIAVIGAVVVPFIARGQWLVAIAISVPSIALVCWLQLVAWRQKHGDGRK